MARIVVHAKVTLGAKRPQKQLQKHPTTAPTPLQTCTTTVSDGRALSIRLGCGGPRRSGSCLRGRGGNRAKKAPPCMCSSRTEALVEYRCFFGSSLFQIQLGSNGDFEFCTESMFNQRQQVEWCCSQSGRIFESMTFDYLPLPRNRCPGNGENPAISEERAPSRDPNVPQKQRQGTHEQMAC